MSGLERSPRQGAARGSLRAGCSGTGIRRGSRKATGRRLARRGRELAKAGATQAAAVATVEDFIDLRPHAGLYMRRTATDSCGSCTQAQRALRAVAAQEDAPAGVAEAVGASCSCLSWLLVDGSQAARYGPVSSFSFVTLHWLVTCHLCDGVYIVTRTPPTGQNSVPETIRG